MEFNYTEFVGILAATCTTASFLPQAIKTIRTKDTKGISLLMYIIFTFGVSCWGAYGYLIGKYTLVFANSFTFILSFTILSIKIRNFLKDRD